MSSASPSVSPGESSSTRSRLAQQDARPFSKVACRACREHKVRCPGVLPEQRACARCFAAGRTCIFDNHRRGRKVGFRFSNKEKAVLRMKAAQRVLRSLESEDMSENPASTSVRPADSYLPHNAELVQQTDIYIPECASASAVSPSESAPSSLRGFFSSISTTSAPAMVSPQQQALDLLRQDPVVCGLISEESARAMFDFYHARIGPVIEVLDPRLHTYDYVRKSSSFLFTAVLTIALKFSIAENDGTLVAQCQALARDQLLRAFLDEANTIHSAQAVLLLTEFKEPEDKSAYLLVGLACRIGMNLDLTNTIPGLSELENRNRTRTWMVLFCADQRFSIAGQVRKLTMMPEDETIIKSASFYQSSLAAPHDVALAGGVRLRRLYKRCAEAANSSSDLGGVFLDFFKHVNDWLEDWSSRVRVSGQEEGSIDACLTSLWLNSLHFKLTIAHRWFYSVFHLPRGDSSKNIERDRSLLICIDLAAQTMGVIASCSPSSFSCVPDSLHLFASYATTFLAKAARAELLKPSVLGMKNTTWIADAVAAAGRTLRQAALRPDHTVGMHADALESLSHRLDDFLTREREPQRSLFNGDWRGDANVSQPVFWDPNNGFGPVLDWTGMLDPGMGGNDRRAGESAAVPPARAAIDLQDFDWNAFDWASFGPELPQ